MRKNLSEQLEALFDRNKFVFLTGDLGFNAFEGLREKMKLFFVNAGVAEQNMISVGAGLCNRGFLAFAYSIAPFCYARPFEQIRNDVCLHALPLTLIGNGGGYGYGVQGPSHHAIDDYGALTTLPNMKAYVPVFGQDIAAIIQDIENRRLPGYLRLGVHELSSSIEPFPYAPWRKLLDGELGIVIGVGSLTGALMRDLIDMPLAERPELWALSELPMLDFPAPLLESIKRNKPLVVAEEHVSRGGAGEMISLWCLKNGIMPSAFHHHCAAGYPSGKYGSQRFHREESGLDTSSIMKSLCMG